MVTIDKVKRGLANFADNEILTKVPGGGLKKMLVGAGISLYISNLERVVLENRENALVAGLGVVHPDGSIDIERLGESIKANVPDEGVLIDIALLGVEMRLHRSDVDTMISYIHNA